MKPEEIERLRTKAAAGEVITQQEAHDMLAEILRLREALEPFAEQARHLAVDALEWRDRDFVSAVINVGDFRRIAATLNGEAP